MRASGQIGGMPDRDAQAGEARVLWRRLGGGEEDEPVIPSLEKRGRQPHLYRDALDGGVCVGNDVIHLRGAIAKRDEIGAEAVALGLGVETNEVIALQRAQDA